MKRGGFKLLPIVVVVLVLGVIGGGLFWWSGQDPANAPTNRFRTVVVARGTLERTVSSTGTLAAVETVTVGTEVSGTVARVLVDYNSRVRKGTVLAILKPDLFNAAVADAEGAVRQAEATLTQAQRDLERNRPLYEKGYLAEQEFLPFQTARDKAAAALSSARAGLASARTNLENSVISSPIDGTVIQRSIDAGQTVAASLNTPTLFIIARDLARMQIEAAVDETDIGQIRDGQAVRFSVQSYPEQTFAGTVRQIRLQPTTVQNVVTYTVIVAADNDRGLLLPGMTATVDFIVERVEDALLVPNSALRFRPTPPGGEAAPEKLPAAGRKNGGSRLFVLDAVGKLQRVAVRIGSSDGQQTVIRGDELKVGDKVVTGVAVSSGKSKGSFSLFGAMRGRPRR